jgi:hypothetical protein
MFGENYYFFLEDLSWLESNGYERGSNGNLRRGGNLPLVKWDQTLSKLKGGWVPTIEEFASWHPADQERFEIEYVYGLSKTEQEVYYQKYANFFLKPLNAINFYHHYINSLNLRSGFEILEVYHANHLTMSAKFNLLNNDFSVETKISSLEEIKELKLFRCVLNNATIYISFDGRVVFNRAIPYVTEEFRLSLENQLISVEELAFLSQEGY